MQEAFFVGDDMPNGRFLTHRKNTGVNKVVR